MHDPAADIATEDVVLLKEVIELAHIEQCRWPALLEAQALMVLLNTVQYCSILLNTPH